MIKISMLWWMWLGGVMYDLVCAWAPFFSTHTPRQRLDEDLAVALFIFAAWINARWILPACSLPRPQSNTPEK
jgi:hypothetical protein